MSPFCRRLISTLPFPLSCSRSGQPLSVVNKGLSIPPCLQAGFFQAFFQPTIPSYARSPSGFSDLILSLFPISHPNSRRMLPLRSRLPFQRRPTPPIPSDFLPERSNFIDLLPSSLYLHTLFFVTGICWDLIPCLFLCDFVWVPTCPPHMKQFN